MTRVEAWLQHVWRKMMVRMKLIDIDTVFMEFLSEKEIYEVLRCAEAFSSPFVAVDRWMEVIGSHHDPDGLDFMGFLCMPGGRSLDCWGIVWVLHWKWTNSLVQKRCSLMAG